MSRYRLMPKGAFLAETPLRGHVRQDFDQVTGSILDSAALSGLRHRLRSIGQAVENHSDFSRRQKYRAGVKTERPKP